MLCPRCNKHTLEERERNGVVMDVCRECRGVWLDRGELERLVSKAVQEMEGQDEARAHVSAYQDRHEYHDKHHGHYEDHHLDRSNDNRHGRQGHEGAHHGKRHWLADLFD